ncbi:FecR family protein [Fibrella aquatilis]|uniref:FecR family protein n=1 Tax=Fibrella aquatilis TaxID=2817059 RepID=A0A939K302_9BACT|nr:FecR family protein [Fibrella aquatilis]MBO0933850.1 FecR family protein [Fibrella aquatilis]
MKPLPFPPDLLDRYRTNTATDDERLTVDAWYDTLPEDSDYLRLLDAASRRQLQEQTLGAIHTSLGLTGAGPQLISFQPRPSRWYRHPWFVAAALVVLVGGWWVIQLARTGNQATSGSATAVVTPGHDITPKQIRFVNQQSRMVARHLPDGTVVWLHPQADLSYPAVFADDRRNVTFSGEGFFDVAKNPHRPFLIQSGPMQIKVLGTSFNVRATPHQAIFEVAVVTGRVLVRTTPSAGRKKTDPVLLLPRQEVLYNLSSNQLTRYSLPANSRRPIYEPVSVAFANAPMNAVVDQLEARFNVRIQVANAAINACKLTADFTNQSLPAILELLCTSLDATYTMAGDTVIITGEGCQ